MDKARGGTCGTMVTFPCSAKLKIPEFGLVLTGREANMAVITVWRELAGQQ
jgi:hypothetical protein